MGIVRPGWKIGGVTRITLKTFERIEARVSSAKERCSLVRWSGPAALLQGRKWMIVEVSSGVTQSGSGLGMSEITLPRARRGFPSLSRLASKVRREQGEASSEFG